MTVSVAQFRTNFPEFTDAPADAVVQRCLDTAARLVGGIGDTGVRDDAQQYYAAHLITQDPRGEPAAARPYGQAGLVQMTNIQSGNRFAKGLNPYLQAFNDLCAAYVIPITVT